jgi:parallel beta-helix repeat protein
VDKKYGLLVLCNVILLACLVGSVSGRTAYVDDDGGADFTKIQDAVDNATAGDTIIVNDGTYIENVDVYVYNLTIKSWNGSASTIVQAANANDQVFEVTGDYVNISGFTIKDSTEWPSGGIYRGNVMHCTISFNNATGNWAGIYFDRSHENNVMNNTITANNGYGIDVSRSGSNVLKNNNCSNNGSGIYLWYSNNSISGNTVCNNFFGIYLDDSSNNTISANTVSNNEYGIYLWNSNDNQIFINDFINNSDNAYSEESTNIWNSPEEITYTYNGSTFTNQLGNYWDVVERYPDAEKKDAAGIWNIPYEIDGDSDDYPLMEPFENYILE